MSKIRFASEEYVDSKLTGAATAQPDWVQNDAAASDYIKNRTHWVEIENGEISVLFDENTVFRTSNSISGGTPLFAGGIYGLDISSIIPNNVYLFLFINNVCEWQGKVIYDENGAFNISNEGNIENLHIYENETIIELSIPGISNTTSKTYPLRLETQTRNETYYPLSENYIPDTIARKTDLEAAINAAIGNAIGGSY